MATAADPKHNAVAYDWASAAYFTYTGTAGASAALSAATLYCLSPSTDCWIKGGSATPTATVGAGSVFVPKGAMFHIYNVTANHKISVIKSADDGAMSIIPVL